jgi:hypothetical protein
MLQNSLIRSAICLFAIPFVISPADASIVRGAEGIRSASAEFTVVGTNLVVTLRNTSPRDVLVPADVLTAVFFDLADNVALTPLSAALSANSTVIYGSKADPFDGAVGGEWAYLENLTNAPATRGISSGGLGLFGPHDRFPGANLAGPNSPAGIQYGIVPAADLTTTGNGGVTGSGGLVKDSIVFTFSGWTSQAAPNVSNVWFQFGSDLSEPRLPGLASASGFEALPESSSMAVWSMIALAAFSLHSCVVPRKGKRSTHSIVR